MDIFPAIDIRLGRCVRLRQGRAEDQTVFNEFPAAQAERFRDEGARFLHLVDLDGAFQGRPRNHAVIGEIVAATSLFVQVGGGIRDEATITAYLDLGVSRVILGTQAVRDPAWALACIDRYGDRVALGLDARQGLLVTEGWVQGSALPAAEFAARFADTHVGAVIFTDVATDGMMQGPNFAQIEALRAATELPVIASGGICHIAHLERLRGMGVAGAIVGRALYEGALTLEQVLVFQD